jgi:maltooligosyltrehalose trehalohydrolase
MPFGATLLEGGRTRFRLWAPGEEQVQLALPNHGSTTPMHRREGGWFELEVAAAAGDPYLFALPGGQQVPDPASRLQADTVHGPSLVVDPGTYHWRHTEWRGRPWAQTVLYELHLGTFSPEGTFEGARARLPYLAELGVTAVELMPIADFAGSRNWGYDGVLPYALAHPYGTPDELKALIDEAHGLGLMVFLDVVYNHFGPEGNYLSLYAPSFFTEDFKTPWGAAIDFREQPVRDYFVHNALYWLEEYRFDGLRFDAVHAIVDPSETHILRELASRVRGHFGPERQIHLVLENEANQAQFLRRDDPLGRLYDAQWADDGHHVLHVLLTGEHAGYYEDFAQEPGRLLARVLSEGFVYQGQPSKHAGGKKRGEPSKDLPALAFVDFLQNHDQIGNRALGERLTELADTRAVQAAQSILLLSPHIPMLYMGEEWGTRIPFQYFCDFEGDLGQAVREGRAREFAGFFNNPKAEVPDPLAETTFTRSKLDWGEIQRTPYDLWLSRTRMLLRLRGDQIAPRLLAGEGRSEGTEVLGGHGVRVSWRLGDSSRLTLLACLGETGIDGVPRVEGHALHFSSDDVTAALEQGSLPPWSAAWFLAEA